MDEGLEDPTRVSRVHLGWNGMAFMWRGSSKERASREESPETSSPEDGRGSPGVSSPKESQASPPEERVQGI